MEILLVLAIFLLAAPGPGLDLMPPRGSCGVVVCVKGTACEGRPNRKEGGA